MYSLYRAWLMRDAVAAATLATPPDVVVNVGGNGPAGPGGSPRHAHQFAAHRAVLAAHSGYLKALLSGANADMAVSVPNVSPEAFAPLLTFMYTGYLDVTHENIYGVLLATHLLHMPRALDLCRAFLVQNQQQPPAPRPPLPTLVKPIPSRKMLPVLLGLPPPPPPGFWPPPTYHSLPPPPPPPPPQLVLHTADASPFRSVLPSALKPEALPELEPLPSPRRRPKSPLAVPSTSSARKRPQSSPSPPSSVSPCLSGSSFSSDDRHVVSASPPERRKKPSKGGGGVARPQTAEQSPTGNGAKVIIDVACCDGPVRFHRVLNDNYGLTLDDILERGKDEEAAVPAAPQEEDSNGSEPPHKDCGSSAASEPGAGGGNSDKVSSSGSAGLDTVYTCLYCNHTFKSHYCYQKHARRHINPVTLDLARLAERLGKGGGAAGGGGVGGAVACKPEKDKDKDKGCAPGVRREVRLLDMNVQYYPCKTCGSKFPSYYFVHKHRKMCHANEETDSVVGSEESHSQSQTATATA